MLTVHVLGPVEVRLDGHPVELGGPQQRAVVAHLALEAGHVVSVERLIDRLWGDDPPRTPLGTLQSYVSRLRRALEPTRSSGASAQVLVSEAPGYVLQVPREHIDVHRFRVLVEEARAAGAAGRHTDALATLDGALTLWRGPALSGVGPDDEVRPIVVRLEAERDAAIEQRFETLLALGRHADAVPQLQAAVEAQPLREGLWALLALALYRCSRQADALRAIDRARSLLLDELGLDPGPELRELERRILDHDPALGHGGHETRPTMTAAEPAPRPHLELVGRVEEWNTLVAALAAARAGRPRLALIEGEPGIGKSTLCDAFLAHAATTGWRTAVGRCVEPGLAPSLWPCIEILRSIVATSGLAHPTTGHTVNPLRRYIEAGSEAGLSLAPVELADQFVALIDELGGEPWVFLIDDLHWGDRATLDAIRLVVERLDARPVLVLGALRPPELVPDSLLGDALGALHRSGVETTRLRLPPLDAVAVGRLLELTSGVTPSGELADRVRTRTGGNPLFVAELARLVGERGLTDASVVPDAIRDVVRSRLAALPERATAELEVAAVLGERFDLRTAMGASERDPDSCLDALDAAIVTRILVPDGDGFRFAHALVRDAVLAEISPLRLARLHHRAAEAMHATWGDAADAAEPIAHHRLASAAFADPLVVAKAAVRASDVARWRNAFDAADRLAEQALAVLTAVPRTPQSSALEVEALEALVSVAHRRADPAALTQVTDRIAEFAERTGSDAARALALFMSWGDVDETDDLRTVAQPLEVARALAARTSDNYALVTTHYMLASYQLLVGCIDDAAEHATAAVAASGTTGPDERPEHVPLVVLPMVAGVIAALQGDRELAREHTHRRTRAWLSQRSEVDPTAAIALAFNRAFVAALLDEPQSVLDELAGLPRTDVGGFIGEQHATCELLTGWASARLGEPGGIDAALAAMAEIDASPERVLRSCLRSLIAEACLALGDRRATALLEQARQEAVERGETWWLAETLRLQAIADGRFGDGAQAAALLDEADALATTQCSHLIAARIAASRDLLGHQSTSVAPTVVPMPTA